MCSAKIQHHDLFFWRNGPSPKKLTHKKFTGPFKKTRQLSLSPRVFFCFPVVFFEFLWGIRSKCWSLKTNHFPEIIRDPSSECRRNMKKRHVKRRKFSTCTSASSERFCCCRNSSACAWSKCWAWSLPWKKTGWGNTILTIWRWIWCCHISAEIMDEFDIVLNLCHIFFWLLTSCLAFDTHSLSHDNKWAIWHIRSKLPAKTGPFPASKDCSCFSARKLSWQCPAAVLGCWTFLYPLASKHRWLLGRDWTLVQKRRECPVEKGSFPLPPSKN